MQPAEEQDNDGAWPHAVRDTSEQMNSLEAELQALRDADAGRPGGPRAND